MLDSLRSLHVFDAGTANAYLFQVNFLGDYVRLFWDAADPNFMFMSDNAQIVDDFLKEDIRLMDWPLRSRTSILLNLLGSPRLNIHRELKAALLEDLDLLPQIEDLDLLHSLESSMRSRYATRIAVYGGHNS